ncbi:MAG: hypothetical protein JW958_10435 [Candidatus Eisenbacteria bacterium]|nr:hypothetical protein [Candidatus Eisenbacteria bacterium]
MNGNRKDRRRRGAARTRAFVIGVCALGFVGAASGLRAATVVSGDASGVWDVEGSPYLVEGDVLVPGESALTIDPGVEVRFRGPYRFLVEGLLTATGAEEDSILFTWDAPDSAYLWRGVRLIGADDSSALEYCRIEHVRSSTAYPEVRGGAVYVAECAPSIRHCLLQENESHNGNWNGVGGGVACFNASPTIEHCLIRNNRADSGGGIAVQEESAPVIRNNRIEGNKAPYCGGGVYVGAFATPVIENNLVLENEADGWGGGGIALWTTNSLHHRTVGNNVIAGNSTSTDGGGFYVRYDGSTLAGNTVVNNSAGETGGGIYVLNFGGASDSCRVVNGVIRGNTAPAGSAVYLYDPSTAFEARYSDVEGGWPGTGNIDADPVFADESFRLCPNSPCVDAGDPDPAWNDVCFPPSLGTARNDMGAYGDSLACRWPEETNTAVTDEWDAEGLAPRAERGLRSLPNPFNPRTEIVFHLDRPEAVELHIYDTRGRLTRRLLDREILPAGPHVIAWDGRDDGGEPLGSGVYFGRLGTGEAFTTIKMTLVR